jgi:hypothetical protein
VVGVVTRRNDYKDVTMIQFSQIRHVSLETLTDELAAAGWDSTQTTYQEAREAVACMLNSLSDLRLYDSITGELVTSNVSDETAMDSANEEGGHVLVDGRLCYVAE